MKRVAVTILISILIPISPSFADLSSPIVWLADGVSLKGYKTVLLHPVSNYTGEIFEMDVTELLTNTIKDELLEAEIDVVDPNQSEIPTKSLILKSALLLYAGGSVSGRWLGMGEGSAVCILRNFIVDESSMDVIGEIVVAKLESVGGLFSANAPVNVPKATAKSTVETLLDLINEK